MKLLIVDSLAEAKKIQGLLGGEWLAVACKGYARVAPRRFLWDPDQPSPAPMALTARSVKLIDELRSLVKDAEAVYLGTPPDADGERVAWQLAESLGLTNPQRIVFSELTKVAIETALSNPRPFRFNLAKSQAAYRFIDSLSQATSQVIQAISGKFFTVNLIEAAALELLYEREKQLQADNASSSYGVELTFSPENQKELTWRAIWNPKNWLSEGETGFHDHKIALRLAELKKVTVASHKEGKFFQNPSPPFTTASLLISSAKNLFLDPLRTLEMATRLYENGHITHPITDNPLLLPKVIEEIRAIAENFGWPMPLEPRVYVESGGLGEGLECVRPVDLNVETAGTFEDEKNLYKLIRLRTISSQMTSAVYNMSQVVLWATIDDLKDDKKEDKKVFFEGKSQRLIKPGFKALLNEDQKSEDLERGQGNPIPKLWPRENLIVRQGRVLTKEATDQGHYTKASLIEELARRGVNRPRVTATAVSNLGLRGYAAADKRGVLRHAVLGQELNDFLVTDFPSLSIANTRPIFEALERVARGEDNWLVAMATFQDAVTKDLVKIGRETALACPDCGQPLRRVADHKVGSPPIHYFCANEECGAMFLDKDGELGSRRLLVTPTKRQCPNCHEPLSYVKGHKNGAAYGFWSCRDREKCGSKFHDVNGVPGEEFSRILESNQTCPDCGSKIVGVKETKLDRIFYRWRCENQDPCGATFKNNHGRPGEKVFKPDDRFPCPECGLPLTHFYGRTKEVEFNYWSCQTERGCRVKFRDDHGVPSQKLATLIKSDRICPDCQSPMVLIKGASERDNYSFWGCKNRENCGARFVNDGGELGERLSSTANTSFLCVECHRSLQLRKGLKNGRFYATWHCVNPDCLQRYYDNHGHPGEPMASSVKTDWRCQLCGEPLSHVVKKGLKSFDFWACSNNQCGANYYDDKGEPGKIKGKMGMSVATEFKCPYCQTKLRRRKGRSVKSRQEYDFFFCPNKYCERDFPVKDDAPVFPSVPGSPKEEPVQAESVVQEESVQEESVQVEVAPVGSNEPVQDGDSEKSDVATAEANIAVQNGSVSNIDATGASWSTDSANSDSDQSSGSVDAPFRQDNGVNNLVPDEVATSSPSPEANGSERVSSSSLGDLPPSETNDSGELSVEEPLATTISTEPSTT
ncbi:MAG: hypothetical protein LBT86_05240 [Deltaproteobacteria bacterium]|nr:hypothetical protein [Deltaproteobacteria bacterium]